MMVEVAIVECDGYEDIKKRVEEAIKLAGGLKTSGKVLIKPNAGSPSPPSKAANTNPLLVAAMVEIIRDHAESVVVGERDGIACSASKCLKKSGIEEAANGSGAEVRLLDDDPQIDVKIDGKRLKSVKLPKTVVECDTIINIPKLKTNSFSLLTLGIKNLMGLIGREDRTRFHRTDLPQLLVDLSRVIKPDLTIIDGVFAMEGQGPVYGNVIDLGLLIAGKDIVATDAVASYVTGFYPEEVDTTRIAAWEGIGTSNMDDIKIVGSDIEVVKKPIKRPLSTLSGMYPNVDVYMGGACKGCYDPLMIIFEGLKLRGELEEMGDIKVIIGKDAPLPDSPGDKTLVIGDCAKEHMDKGLFIEGCPPILDLFKIRLS